VQNAIKKYSKEKHTGVISKMNLATSICFVVVIVCVVVTAADI